MHDVAAFTQGLLQQCVVLYYNSIRYADNMHVVLQQHTVC
jgi:hypothetical protein